MKRLLITLGALSLCAYANADGEATWGYAGPTGPQNWGTLSPAYKTCSSGRTQSPIDLVGLKDEPLPEIKFAYRAGGNVIVNNGHTIQVNYAPGSFISVDGKQFELKQFHFHAPSENHVRGKSFPMEAHFVHADQAGHLAVIAVMLEAGAANAVLANAWGHLPQHAGEKLDIATAVPADGLLPSDRGYYQFTGSLTTPPCTEGVLWLVLKQPMTVSKAQISQFSHVIHHPNNRPVQALNGRVVLE